MSYPLSSLSVEQLKTLETAVYNDVLNRVTRTSYSVAGKSFTFSSLAEIQNFLGWIRNEISIRSAGGGFMLARMMRE